MPRSSAALAALVGLLSAAGCSTETIAAPDPGLAPAGTADPSPTPPTTPDSDPVVNDAPWKETHPLVADVRAISCPSDTEVHIATSLGLYRLEGDAWKTVAAGDFSAVSMTSETSGFAGGDGVFLQRSGSTWSSLAAASWKVRAIYTNADGAFVGGSGYMYIGRNQLPVEPLVWFVGNDLTLRDDYAFGSRITAGSVTSIAGSGAYAVLSAGSYVMSWSGLAWDPVGSSGPQIASLFTYKQNLLAVGNGGAILQRTPKGDYQALKTSEGVDLTAGCVTGTGTLWVAGGNRVFRRHDPL